MSDIETIRQDAIDDKIAEANAEREIFQCDGCGRGFHISEMTKEGKDKYCHTCVPLCNSCGKPLIETPNKNQMMCPIARTVFQKVGTEWKPYL